MKVVEISYTMDIRVRNLEDKLLIDYVVKHEGQVLKTTTYVYTEEEVKSIDEKKSYKNELKNKENFVLLKNYIVDIIELSSISPLKKYMLLTRYIKNSILERKEARNFIEKLIYRVKIEKEDKVSSAEAEFSYIMDVKVKILREQLIVDYIYKCGDKPFKETTYIYTEDEIISIDDSKSYRTKARDKEVLDLLRNYISDILESSSVEPLIKYLLLTIYMKKTLLFNKETKNYIKKLVEQVNLAFANQNQVL